MIEKDLVTSLKTICVSVHPLFLPQKVVFPAMRYQVIHDGVNQATNGNFSSRNIRFQVDVYAKSYKEAKELKDLVFEKVIELKGGSISAQYLYEDETKLFRQLIDFKIKRT